MYTEQSINIVKDRMEIEQVVSHFVPLKKKGQNHWACCPFHDEKSPSFTVSPAKGIYKCFGCGSAGDSIKFLMEYQKSGFIEAIEWLASFYNVELEKAATDDPVQIEAQGKRKRMYEANSIALASWRNALANLPEEHYVWQELMGKRWLDRETIAEFQIGFAPDSWDYIKNIFAPSGLLDIGRELGLTQYKNEKNYDAFRNRIIFPILNTRGNIVGFGGQDLSPIDPSVIARNEAISPDSPSHKTAKYLNSPESEVYRKYNILFGLYQAQYAIRKQGHAVLVEGYYDVVNMHRMGVGNTVGICGTSFTVEQARLLKKFTDTVVMLTDADGAGQKSALRNIDILLAEGMDPQYVPLPDGMDPDDYCRAYSAVQPLTMDESSPLGEGWGEVKEEETAE